MRELKPKPWQYIGRQLKKKQQPQRSREIGEEKGKRRVLFLHFSHFFSPFGNWHLADHLLVAKWIRRNKQDGGLASQTSGKNVGEPTQLDDNNWIIPLTICTIVLAASYAQSPRLRQRTENKKRDRSMNNKVQTANDA